MTTILKYKLNSEFSSTVLNIPAGFQPLYVYMLDDVPYLWALVDTTKPKVEAVIDCHGTGHSIDDRGTYIGTVQHTAKHASYFWHFFLRSASSV